jgi:DNA polymerase-3 subunit beta
MIVFQAPCGTVLAALQAVVGVVERRHTLPVLANVLIRKSGSQVEFITSDLELQLRTRVELGGDAGDFATTVAARKLLDILRAMPAAQEVTLRAVGDKLTLRGGRSRFLLHTLPADGFPLLADAADLGAAFTLPQATLKALVARVEFAMAVRDIRYFFNGMLFIVDGALLRVVATDGNRLALAEATLAHALPKHEVILPRKAVHELQRHLRDGAPPSAAEPDAAGVAMRFGASQARFSVNGVEFVTQLIDGRFPDFNRVIPTGHPHALTLERAPFLASLLRVAVLTSERFRGIRLKLASGALQIVADNAEREQAHEDLEVDYDGPALEIGFNVGYLIDVLAHTGVATVRMEMRDAGSGVLFSFPDQPGFKYVVSPMRL